MILLASNPITANRRTRTFVSLPKAMMFKVQNDRDRALDYAGKAFELTSDFPADDWITQLANPMYLRVLASRPKTTRFNQDLSS